MLVWSVDLLMFFLSLDSFVCKVLLTEENGNFIVPTRQIKNFIVPTMTEKLPKREEEIATKIAKQRKEEKEKKKKKKSN